MRDDDVGFNTTMIVLNDALHAIENDKDFGKKVAQAIRDLNLRPDDGRGIDISSGNNANAATVVEQHHADYSVLCAVGGNCVTVLGSVLAFRHNTEPVQYQLLKMLADKLGYILRDKADAEHASEQ
jgi:hypothetical protein